MARSTFDLDVRGLLGARAIGAAQPAAAVAPATAEQRQQARADHEPQADPQQQNLDGSPFEARKGSAKGKKKMEAGLGKLLQVTRVS
jgi:hypothetical protein